MILRYWDERTRELFELQQEVIARNKALLSSTGEMPA